MLYPTMMFRVNGVDPTAAGEAWRTIPALMDEAEQARRRIPAQGRDRAAAEAPDRMARQRHAGEERRRPRARRHRRATNSARARSRAAGRRCDFFEFLKREAPGFADAYIVDIPPQLGIRETRRITGRYQLTADDVLTCASFDDTIGVNGWPIEAHVAGDVEWAWPDIPGSRGFNHLPYRMLLPQRRATTCWSPAAAPR